MVARREDSWRCRYRTRSLTGKWNASVAGSRPRNIAEVGLRCVRPPLEIFPAKICAEIRDIIRQISRELIPHHRFPEHLDELCRTKILSREDRIEPGDARGNLDPWAAG